VLAYMMLSAVTFSQLEKQARQAERVTSGGPTHGTSHQFPSTADGDVQRPWTRAVRWPRRRWQFLGVTTNFFMVGCQSI